MKTITILAQKGGTGKTTLSIHMATAAAAGSGRVLIADTDPQSSAMVWQKRRKHGVPKVLPFSISRLKKDLAPIRQSGTELVIIDTPPHSTKAAITAANLADFVVIPCRPALLDLSAIKASVDIAKETGRPAGIVLNCCPPPNRYGEPSVVREARLALKEYGLEVAPTAISQRVAFSYALYNGRAVTESESNGKAAEEIRDLWNWLQLKLS